MYLKLNYYLIYIIFVIDACLSASIQEESRIKNESIVPLKFTISNGTCRYYDGVWTGIKCYRFFIKGPCKDDEWLVLDKEQYVNNEGHLQPICKKKLCTNDEIWWPNIGECRDNDFLKTMYCNKSDLFITKNLFGEGICSCIYDRFGRFSDNEYCFQYYTKGPCKDGEVVVYDVLSGYAVCKADRCMHKNEGEISDDGTESNVRNVTYYAPMYDNGECYALKSHGPCNASDTFEVYGKFHIPNCKRPFRAFAISSIGARELCHSRNNKCIQNVKVVKAKNQAGWDD